jgi:hypothetical protein
MVILVPNISTRDRCTPVARREVKMADKNKVGLVAGALLGGWHVVWSILVATGVGQTLDNLIL